MMFKTRILFVPLILFVTSVGCSSVEKRVQELKPRDLLIRESDTLNRELELDPQEVKEDMAHLIYALQKGYGGRKFVPQETLNTTIEKLTEIGNSGKPYLPSALCREVDTLFFQIPDNHLAIRFNRNDCIPEREALAQQTVGQNVKKEKSKIWQVSYVPIEPALLIPVVSITSFADGKDSAWKGFLDELWRLKQSAPAIIFDVRGNGGGSDTMAFNIAHYFYGDNPSTPNSKIVKSNTPETMALKVNSSSFKMKLSKDGIAPNWLFERFNRDLRNFEKAEREKWSNDTTEIADGSANVYNPLKGWNKPIYILTDRQCASACEDFVGFFEAYPLARTVGDRTSGAIHFGNVGALVLPKSQLWVSMATDYWQRKDGKFLERIGIEPSISVPVGADALETAKIQLKRYFPTVELHEPL